MPRLPLSKILDPPVPPAPPPGHEIRNFEVGLPPTGLPGEITKIIVHSDGAPKSNLAYMAHQRL